jgi:hypothetical protein
MPISVEARRSVGVLVGASGIEGTVDCAADVVDDASD